MPRGTSACSEALGSHEDAKLDNKSIGRVGEVIASGAGGQDRTWGPLYLCRGGQKPRAQQAGIAVIDSRRTMLQSSGPSAHQEDVRNTSSITRRCGYRPSELLLLCLQSHMDLKIIAYETYTSASASSTTSE